MASDPVAEMRAFIDEMQSIVPLTVNSDPDENVPTTVKIGATDQLVEVANSAEAHGLLLTYDGLAITALAKNPEALPTVTAGGAGPTGGADMNRGELTMRVSRMLGVSRGTSDDELDETDLLNELANEAVIDVLSRTRVNIRKLQMTLDSGVSEFDLDEDVLRMYDAKRGTQAVSKQTLGDMGSTATASSATTGWSSACPARARRCSPTTRRCRRR